MARKKSAKTESEKLDTLIALTQTMVAIELSKGGVPQAQIAKTLGIATATVNNLLKGYKAQ